MAALMELSPLLTPSSALERAEPPLKGGACATATLTSGLASGEEEAFRNFHALYFNRLLRYHLVIARGDEESAREALQETFLRVVRHARKFDDERAFWCWLTVLARSAACDVGRNRQRYWRLIANYARWLLAPPANIEPDDADERLNEILIDSLSELNGLDRALVEGKYLHHSSVRELAAEFGLTPKAVESRLLRARRELRDKTLKKVRDES